MKLQLGITWIVVTLLTAACGGGGGGSGSESVVTASSTSAVTTLTAENSAPSISGSTTQEVAAGSPYQFTPTSSDADGDTLTFSVSGMPPWASFKPEDGSISGTPQAEHVGSYENIRITVSDGERSSTLQISIEVVAIGLSSALLSWTPPTRNVDGSVLTDLDGYKVYWGQSADSYSHSAPVDAALANYLVENLTAGTWFFAVTAINERGVESDYSRAVTANIP